MGVTKNHLGNWMRGDAYPRHYEVYRLCRVTGLTTDYLYLGDPSGLPKRLLDKLVAPEEAQEPR